MSSLRGNFYKTWRDHNRHSQQLRRQKERQLPPEALLLSSRKAGPDPLWWAGTCQPIDSLEGHFLTMGKSGSGKSLTTKITLRSILMSLRPGRNRRVIIFDTKGDTLAFLQGMKNKGELKVPFQLLSINDQRSSAWHIAADVRRYDKARDVVSALAPRTEAKDPFWQNCSSAVMTYCMKSLIKRYGTDWTFRDFYNANLSTIDHVQEILRWFDRGDEVVDMLFNKDASKTTAGIRTQLFTQLEPLEGLAAQSQLADGPGISLEEVLKADQVLVIGQDFTARQSSQPFVQAVFQRLVELISASSDDDNAHTFLVLDECRFLGKFPKLLELITFSRSKGAHCIITAQGIGGLQELYGRNVAEEIFENCDYKSLFNLGSRTSAEWAANLIGRVPIWDASGVSGTGANVSVNRQFRKKERVTYDDFLELPLPNKRHGLYGYFRSNQMQPSFFKQFFPANMINHLLPPVDRTVPAQVPWDHNEFYVRPWTSKERYEFLKGVRSQAEQTQQKGGRDMSDMTGAVVAETFDLISDIHQTAIRNAKNRRNPSP